MSGGFGLPGASDKWGSLLVRPAHYAGPPPRWAKGRRSYTAWTGAEGPRGSVTVEAHGDAAISFWYYPFGPQEHSRRELVRSSLHTIDDYASAHKRECAEDF
jgi:hypothetical protein